MSDFDCLLGSCGRIVVDVGWFGALGHGDFGGGGRIPPTSAMSMGATERDIEAGSKDSPWRCVIGGGYPAALTGRDWCVCAVFGQSLHFWGSGGQTILKTVCLLG